MRYLDGLLLACLVLVAGFHVQLFRELNAAPVLQVQVSSAQKQGFQVRIEQCHTAAGKLAVAGWISGPTERTRLHATTAAVRDESTGQLRGMTTDLLRSTPFFIEPSEPPQRPGVVPTRFVASLNLRAVPGGISRGEVLMVHQRDDASLVVSTGCTTP